MNIFTRLKNLWRFSKSLAVSKDATIVNIEPQIVEKCHMAQIIKMSDPVKKILENDI